MRELTWDDFSEAEGRTYRVPIRLGEEETDVALVLAAAQELPSGLREGGSFRLEFTGPRQPILPQAIYTLEHGNKADEIFIVPVASDARGTTYEAVFN